MITVVRIALLALLAAILFRTNKLPKLFLRRGARAAIVLTLIGFAKGELQAQKIPNETMLNQLRERLLETADAFPERERFLRLS